jgi:hypothetical protein
MTSLTRHLPDLARIMLGLIFSVFGLDGFLHFLPLPPLPGPASELLTALTASGFVMLLVKGVETVAGLLLLANRFVPLALVLLAPIIVVIVGFHLVLAPASAGIALLVLALELYLARAHRAAFGPMFHSRFTEAFRAEPGARSPGRAPARA